MPECNAVRMPAVSRRKGSHAVNQHGISQVPRPSPVRADSLTLVELSARTKPRGSSSLSISMRAHAGTIPMKGALTLMWRRERALSPPALACAIVRSAGMMHRIHYSDSPKRLAPGAPIEWQ